jgi:hypothetical protein
MDLAEQDDIDREAKREKTSDDPQATGPRDGKSLMVMVAAALTATALVLGMMWMNNMRYDLASARTLSEQSD